MHKVVSFIAKEVVTQYRLRMDVGTSSKRSKEEQESFKCDLISYYQRQHPTDNKLLKCMVLYDFFPRHLVIASHIWKYCTRGKRLEEFGLKEDDLNNPRNGLLMCGAIEQAFDIKRLCFLVDRLHQDNLIV
jgi:hypothetical protein